jgi:RNA polymerase sigma-70 factor (ECF subfamily)
MPIPRSRAPLSLVRGGPARRIGDAELARGLAAAEDWALAETWRRFAPMVIMTAQRALGSRAEAEDVAQEVFYRVFRRAKTLREPDALRSFVYSFAIRVLRSELRQRQRRRWLLPFQAHQAADGPSDARAADVESRDLLRRFNALLDRLRPRDRLVFVLRRMDAMTVDEIAATMGLSISTVKRSMAHASNRLSSWVDADPGLAGLMRGKSWVE